MKLMKEMEWNPQSAIQYAASNRQGKNSKASYWLFL